MALHDPQYQSKAEPKRVDYFQLMQQEALYNELTILYQDLQVSGSVSKKPKKDPTQQKVQESLKHVLDDAIVIQCNSKYHKYEHGGNRGTKFRGVSKNGRCNWQVLTMFKQEKIYLGTVDNVLKAALLYDILAI